MRGMVAFTCALVLCACAAAQGGGWAAVEGIAPGSTVKVELLRAKAVTGMLTGASASGMEVRTPDGATRHLDRAQIKRVYLVGESRTLRDAAIGAGIGGTAGVFLAVAAYHPSNDSSCIPPCIPERPWSKADVAVVHGAATAAIGAVIGAVIGSRRPKTLVYQRESGGKATPSAGGVASAAGLTHAGRE